MFESKYSKVLTVILVIVIVAIVGLLGFLGYDYYKKYMVTKDTEGFVDNFQGEVSDQEGGDDAASTDGNPFEQEKDKNSSTTKKTYKGFGVLGTMEIPTIKLKYPVLEKVTKKSIETAIAFLYGSGLNEAGNSVIIGHNYRNGLFFSNIKKLNIGDKIYITDNSGKKLTYSIYNKFETSPQDTSYMFRDTGGIPEITLATCSQNGSARLILYAK